MKRLTALFLAVIGIVAVSGCVGAQEPFYGTWTIKKDIPTSNVAALDDKAVQALIGKEATYSAARATFGSATCRNPRYKKFVVSKEDFFDANRIDLKELGIGTSFVTEIDIYDADKKLFGILYVKGTDTLVFFDDGVYFELTRKPVGQQSKS